MGPEAVRRGAAWGKSARGTCHGARQARSQGCERDRAAGAHRAQCQARTGVGEARTRSSADEGRGGERSSEWQGVCWVPRTSLGEFHEACSSVPAYSGTRRKDGANHDQKKQCFLGSNQGGLPGGGSSALGLQRQANSPLRDEGKRSPAGWLRMALEAGTTHSDLETGQALGTDFAKGSSSTSPWLGPLFLTA